MGRRSSIKKEGSTLDSNAWMATMSDLVFLLITFFVLLISMSSLDAKKMKNAFGFFDDAVDVLKYPAQQVASTKFMQPLRPISILKNDQVKTDTPDEVGARDAAAKVMIELLSESLITEDGLKNGNRKVSELAKKASGSVSIEVLKDGYSVTLPGRLIFDDGSLEVGEGGKEVLADIASIVKVWGGDVFIEGIWPWHEAAEALAAITDHLDSRWIEGDSLHPVAKPGNDRIVKFELRER